MFLIRLLTVCLMAVPLAPTAEWIDVPIDTDRTAAVTIVPTPAKTPSGVLILLGFAGGGKRETAASYDLWWKRAPAMGWHVIAIAAGEVANYPSNAPAVVARVLDWVSEQENRQAIATLPKVLAGASSGGHAVLACLAASPETYQGAIAIPGMWAGRPKVDLGGTRVALRVGGKDQKKWRTRVTETADLLRAAGAEVDFAEIPGADHLPRIEALTLLAWVHAKQQK